MANESKLRIMVVIATLSFTSVVSYADSNTVVSKGVWLDKFKSMAPTVMCRSMLGREDTRKILNTNHISYDKCLPLITKSMNSCIDKFSPALPATLDMSESKKWG